MAKNNLSPSKKRSLLLLNCHARQCKKLIPEIVDELQKLGVDYIQESTQNPRHLNDVLRQYRNQVDLVIIGGGDGTLNAAVDALVETQLPLAILPLGTANDLARTLGIPQSIPDACQVIGNGELRRIDLGWVNGKHFFNVASLGLSVQITQNLTKEKKRRYGVLAYAVTAMQVIWQARPFSARIQINGETIHKKTVQIAVGNGRYYGGGMKIAPDAEIDDQRLDLYSMEMQHWWQIVTLLPAIRRGLPVPGVRLLHGQEIEVSTQTLRRINTDGEITTQTPAKFRVLPQALSVMVPNTSS